MSALPKGGSAVMAQRREPPDSLDFFPTPPWATRALIECVLPKLDLDLGFNNAHVLDPACGEGHMSEVLREYARRVVAADVHDYGPSCDHVGSYVGEGLDVLARLGWFDWAIFNPPYNCAEAFLARALTEAEAVAMLVRTQWLETEGRYERIFAPTPPLAIAQFSERVPMHKGRWDPAGATMSAYCWCVWLAGASCETRFLWIPPGQRTRLTRPDDIRRFARPSAEAS